VLKSACWTATNTVISDAYRPSRSLELIGRLVNPFMPKIRSSGKLLSVRCNLIVIKISKIEIEEFVI